VRVNINPESAEQCHQQKDQGQQDKAQDGAIS
jgi:hypothetical protein